MQLGLPLTDVSSAAEAPSPSQVANLVQPHTTGGVATGAESGDSEPLAAAAGTTDLAAEAEPISVTRRRPPPLNLENNRRLLARESRTVQRANLSAPITSEPQNLPINLCKYYRDILTNAEQQNLESMDLFLSDIGPELARRGVLIGTESAPVVRAAALTVVTIMRHTMNKAMTLKNVRLLYDSETQKKVYEDLLERYETLRQHRVYQALLRPPIQAPTEATSDLNFLAARKCATYVPPLINSAVDNDGLILEPVYRLPKKLLGLELTAWKKVPASARQWNTNAAVIREPVAPNTLIAAGVVVVEKDGRVWVFAPANQLGDKKNTFPRGRIGRTSGLTAQACARKEAYEKSGLQISLKRHLIDIDEGSGTTRYYLAERIGGTPADAGWESQAVSLVPMKKLLAMFEDDGKCTHERERNVMQAHQHVMLMAGLEASKVLRNSLIKLSAWTRDLASRVLADPHALDDSNNVMVTSFDASGLNVSEQINTIVMKWRNENCQLIDDAAVRSRSMLLHAATVLKPPADSAIATLHANRIPLNGIPFAFFAARRPQTLPSAAVNPGNLRSFAQSLVSRLIEPPQTGSLNRIDNSVTFWQTVLKEKVNVIVDLSDVDAEPNEPAYGPVEIGHTVVIGTHRLTLRSVKPQGKLRDEQIIANDATNNPPVGMTRLHYLAWPEGKTISPKALIDLAREVVLVSLRQGTNVLVHSTRGAGRAGTLITFIAASEQITELLQVPKMMTPETLVNIVMNIVVRGRVERGSGFVNSGQIQLIFAALLQKHFDHIEPAEGAANGVLIGR